MVISGVFLILLVSGMKYEERKIHNLLCSFLLPRRILSPPGPSCCYLEKLKTRIKSSQNLNWLPKESA